MVEQAVISVEKNLPRGTMENVPARMTGSENKELLSPTQDKNTDERRAKYGEEPAFKINTLEPLNREPYDVNDVKTPANPVMLEQIRLPFKATSYGMSMCQ